MSPSSCSTISSSSSSESAKRCSSSYGSSSNSCSFSAAAAFSLSKPASHSRPALKTEISLSRQPHWERLMPQARNDFLMTFVVEFAKSVFKWFVPAEVKRLNELCATARNNRLVHISFKEKFFCPRASVVFKAIPHRYGTFCTKFLGRAEPSSASSQARTYSRRYGCSCSSLQLW